MLTKTRHNKKRNTAFLYEALVRELTKCIVSKDETRKGIVVSLVKEHFAKGTALRSELDLYKTLYESEDLDARLCEKLLNEVKRGHDLLNKDEIFSEQTALINKINKLLSKNVFSNFVPNYKNLATIAQILNPDVSIKHRVLLEGNLIEAISAEVESDKEPMAPIDNLVYKTFVSKFNEQYDGKLLEEQRELLSKYIASFHDEGFGLKIYLNEEVSRLKSVMATAAQQDEILEDEVLLENATKVLNILNEFRDKEIDPAMIEQVLKVQQLAKELSLNGN
tara:strand:- start:506 stop:1342 length:837 start_codon:yes stop_codon:yes gene_type:complete